MTQKKTALVIGATGLVGKQLVLRLLKEDNISAVRTFSRRSLDITHCKLEEQLIDFNNLSHSNPEIWGDMLFSCMGTTLKTAGSKEAQFRVDYTYPFEFARIAASNGIREYYLVSAVNASADSSLFYPRIKGQLEESIRELPFERISVFRPSVLKGKRQEPRFGEALAAFIIDAIQWVPGLRNYRSIEGEELAAVIIRASRERQADKTRIYAPSDIWKLVQKKEGN